MVFSECSEFLADVLETSESGVLKMCTDVLRCSLDVLRMFSGFFHDVLWMFSDCFHDI